MFPHRLRLPLVFHLTLGIALALFGLLWWTCLISVGYAQSAPEALGSLSGVVRNAQGDALANIDVSVAQYFTDAPFRTTKSDEKGAYEFASLIPGTFQVKFTDPSGVYADAYFANGALVDQATNVPVTGNDVKNIDMTLTPGGSISITIQSSAPVTTPVDISLYRLNNSGRWSVYRSTLQQQRTDNHLQIGGLSFGRYRLCLSFYGLAPGEIHSLCYNNKLTGGGQLPPSEGDDIVIDTLNPVHITLDFDAISQFQGRVLTSNNQPLSGILILAEKLDGLELIYGTYSDAEGNFRFGNLPPYKYRIIANYLYGAPAEYPGEPYLPLFYPNALSLSGAEVLDIQLTTRISATMKLSKSSQITGTVTLPGGIPAANPTLRIYKKGSDSQWTNDCLYSTCPRSAYDPASGVYTMTNLPPGQYRLSAEQLLGDTSYAMVSFYGGTELYNAQTVTLGAGKKIGNINIVIGDHGFDGVITGTVTAGGLPQAGIEVGLHAFWYSLDGDFPSLTTTTDAQGNYQLRGLSAGSYRVSARDPLGRFTTEFYDSDSGDHLFFVSGIHATPNINLDLSPAGTIRGHIHTPYNEPPSGYHLYVFEFISSDETPASGFYAQLYYFNVLSDIDGFYEIKGLAPKNYLVSATAPDLSIFPVGTQEYYPGTEDQSKALTVTVQAGIVTEGVDIHFGPFYGAKLPFIGFDIRPVEQTR